MGLPNRASSRFKSRPAHMKQAQGKPFFINFFIYLVYFSWPRFLNEPSFWYSLWQLWRPTEEKLGEGRSWTGAPTALRSSRVGSKPYPLLLHHHHQHQIPNLVPKMPSRRMAVFGTPNLTPPPTKPPVPLYLALSIYMSMYLRIMLA